MVSDKAQQSKGDCAKDTDPRKDLGVYLPTEGKTQYHSHDDCQQRENGLPQGQSKKDRFGVVPNLAIDFYFHEFLLDYTPIISRTTRSDILMVPVSTSILNISSPM